MPTDDEATPRAKRRGVEERFEMLRMLAGLFAVLGVAPWACVVLVYLGQADRFGLWTETRGVAALGLGAVATVTTVIGMALNELIQLLVSVEHTLRVIAARLKRSEP
jgi:hypothetical protein